MNPNYFLRFATVSCLRFKIYFNEIHGETFYNNILKNLKSFCEKKAFSIALGFEPRSFDCRSTALTTELHRGIMFINFYIF